VAARADSEETLAVEERTLQRSVLPPTVASASPDVTTAAAGKRLTAASDLLPDGADILVPSTTKPFIEPNRRRKIFVINTCLIAGLTTGGSLIVAGPLFVDHASDFFPLLILWLFDFLWWGLLLGLGQAALLRRSISPAAWILSTLLGTAVARITNTVLVGSLLGLSGGSVAFIFAYTLGPGLLRNLPQWLVLRRRVKNAWLWPTFSLCVAVIFAALGGGFPHYRYEIIEYAIARVLPLALVIGLLQSLCLSLFTLKDGQDYYATGEPRDLSRLSRRDKVLSIAIVVALVMLLAGFAGMLLQEEYEFILMIQFGGLIGLPAALIGSVANVLIKNGPLRWFLPAVVGGMFVVILGIISNSDASAYLPISIALGGFSVLSVALSNAVLSVLETVRSPSQTDLATQQL
jgi:MFS family permease